MKNTFIVSYVTTKPKEGDAPNLTIIGDETQKYLVLFYEKNNNELLPISKGYCNNNQTIFGNTKQWFTNWYIEVYDENNNLVFTDTFNPINKTIYIKFDAYALGDTIAWIPYVEEFRKKYNATILCSTFHNNILKNSYKDIIFVKPNSVVENIYAQYYIGAANDENPFYSPIKVNYNPLQKVASTILGLENIELNPILKPLHTFKSRLPNQNYITLSEFGSAENKHWKEENGWQQIVDFLNEKNYKVLVISKEKTNLKNIIDLTGDYTLEERMIDITHAKLHMGVSSGLSWLAWGLGTHTLMISDVTPNWHEFNSNITRLNANILESVDYTQTNFTRINVVLDRLNELLKDIY